MRAALRALGPEDIPFLVDLLERVDGQPWRRVPKDEPSIEEIMMHTFYVSIGRVVTGNYKGHVAHDQGPGAERRIAFKIRDKL